MSISRARAPLSPVRSWGAVAICVLFLTTLSGPPAAAADDVTVSGHIAEAGTGMGVEGTRVRFVDPINRTTIVADARANWNGDYVAVIPAGNYLVYAAYSGYALNVRGSELWSDAQPYSYTADTELDFTMVPGARVQVTTTPDVTLEFYFHAASGWVRFTQFDSWSANSSDPRYVVRHATSLPQGTYRIATVVRPGAGRPSVPRYVGGATRFADADDVELASGEDYEIPGPVELDPLTPAFFQTPTRVSGADRFEASANIAKRAYPTPGIPVAYVATGLNYPDALTAGALAAHTGGPLLLTLTDGVPSSVYTEIHRLDPDRIVIVGGPASVSSMAESPLAARAPTTRLAGPDRFAASRAMVEAGWRGQLVDVIYLATGLNFPDALSAGAAAGVSGSPVLLINGSAPTLDAATLALLAELHVREVRIAGGTASVSQGIENQLSQLYLTSRYGGADRFSAAVSITESSFFHAQQAFLATGLNFPDALAGSAWAGVSNAPLYTVQTGCVPAATLQSMANLGVEQVTLLGGPNSLTSAVASLTMC